MTILEYRYHTNAIGQFDVYAYNGETAHYVCSCESQDWARRICKVLNQTEPKA